VRLAIFSSLGFRLHGHNDGSAEVLVFGHLNDFMLNYIVPFSFALAYCVRQRRRDFEA